ncbi:MAG: hypothetical protein WAW86_06165 [Gammaproteobacteria bacterium]
MKGLRLFALGILSISSAAFAFDPYGVCHLNNETVDSMVCYGPAVLKDATIKGDVKVSGALTGTNINSNAVMSGGAANLKDSTIKGLADINGDLDANHVDFGHGLLVTANHIRLNASSVVGSIVVDIDNEHSPQVYLECGSTVSGNVEFKGKKAGLVQVTDDSLVKGKVINGTMEFVRKICDKK